MIANTNRAGRDRAQACSTLALGLVTSVSLHAFVYAAALNACFGLLACPAFAMPELERSDAVVERTERVTVRQRAPQASLGRPRPAVRGPDTSSLAMRGRVLPLRRGQGQYWPLSSWTVGQTRYYFVAYRFRYRNGTLETGRVPWPVHFARGGDPFTALGRADAAWAPLPPPPADFMPPGTLGKALRAYFPRLSFAD